MAPLKIYGTPASTCTGRVLTTALEVGAEFEIENINLAIGQHKQPEFLALQVIYAKKF